MKRLFIFLAAAFLASTTLAQGVKIMQIIKNDAVDFEIPVSRIDSIIFRSITSDEGIVINGIRWATRNVDAPGVFAPNPHSAGMFYQWNRRVGWSSTNPMTNSDGGTAWNSSIPGGTSWTRENDPCPAGWRVPTQAELTNISNQPSVWTTRNGVTGRVFGTAPNQIFLPAAGWRNANGTLSNVGTFGSYWSNGGSACCSAWSLGLGSTSSSVVSGSRVNGHSVRCVAE